MTYEQAKNEMQGQEKIIYGTRSKAWHIIAQADRDYFTTYAISKSDAEKLNEVEASIRSING